MRSFEFTVRWLAVWVPLQLNWPKMPGGLTNLAPSLNCAVDQRPHRLARPRTSDFRSDNGGSNPPGVILFEYLARVATMSTRALFLLEFAKIAVDQGGRTSRRMIHEFRRALASGVRELA